MEERTPAINMCFLCSRQFRSNSSNQVTLKAGLKGRLLVLIELHILIDELAAATRQLLETHESERAEQRESLKLQEQLRLLKERYDTLPQECDDCIIQLAYRTFENDKMNRELVDYGKDKAQLEQLIATHQAIIPCLKADATLLAQGIEVARLKRALSLFKMTKIVTSVSQPSSFIAPATGGNRTKTSSSRTMHVTGCSTILGIPLQNNGHYEGTPFDIVTSALGHIGQLVKSLSEVLNIPLPHPIRPRDIADCCCILPHGNQSTALPLMQAQCPKEAEASAFRWQSMITQFPSDYSSLQMPQDSMPNTSLSSSSPLSSASNENSWHANRSFPAALTLLQADVLVLCLKAEVPAANLHPAVALLPNLKALEAHCRFRLEQIAQCVAT